MDDVQMEEFVNNFDWIFAKTYAKKAPHEYIVKTKISDPDLRKKFDEVVIYIREAGFDAYYFKRRGKYYVLDDYYYWTMGAPVNETIILNRAKLSDYKLINGRWLWKGHLKDENLQK